MTTSIRAATLADAEELARLRWEFRVEHGSPETTTYDAFVEEFRAFVHDVLAEGTPWRAWVAEDEGRLVGQVWVQLVEKVPHPGRRRWERPVAYLTNMYVEPSLRGGGLGRVLLDEAVAFAREHGVDGVALWPSERSTTFYRRAGFEPEGWLWLHLDGD